MKKEYKKPIVIIEDFALCESIATSCSETIIKTEYELQTEFGITLFQNYGTGGCEVGVAQAREKNCYHVPIETQNLVTS